MARLASSMVAQEWSWREEKVNANPLSRRGAACTFDQDKRTDEKLRMPVRDICLRIGSKLLEVLAVFVATRRQLHHFGTEDYWVRHGGSVRNAAMFC